MASRRKLAAVADAADLFLYDYKATDPQAHQRLTGASNTRILDNLAYLYARAAHIVLRCPLIPGVYDTSDHLAGIAALSARYPRLAGVEILPFHNMERNKAARIGCINPLADLPGADDATKAHWVETLHQLGCMRAQLH